jgi:hypothetical protein
MLTARFDEVFLVPVRRKTRAKPRPLGVEELEFSDYGREPHQKIGWVLLGILGFWAVTTAVLFLI